MDDLCMNLSFQPDNSTQRRGGKKDKKGTKRKNVAEDVPDLDAVPVKPKTKKRRVLEAADDEDEPSKKSARANSSSDTGFISSLFGRNPEVPSIDFQDVEPISEPVFSSDCFKDISAIHPYMVSNLEQSLGITRLTTVQKLAIPELLLGKDALIRSQTGSGKTVAYAVPIVQSLQKIRPKLRRDCGIKAVVVLPTRELALQTYETFLKLVKSFTWLVPGLLAGGERKKSEKARLRRGITVLVATPGRLLDHIQHTKVLSLHLVNWFVLDEADKLLDLGYEKDIATLIQALEKHRSDYEQMLDLPRRQTVLLSATLTPAVEKLAGLTLDNPSRIDACQRADVSEQHHTIENFVIPDSLVQKYVVVAPKLRLVTLASFVVRKCEVEGKSKMLIFMATQDMVDFYTHLLSTVLPQVADFVKLHGNMTQSERVAVFKSFRSTSSGILLCTDVAARGLDLPKVDWIVQYTAPATPADYVHRVGRTARVGNAGSALVFLAPSEVQFLEQLNAKRIKLKEENVNYCLESLLLVDFESREKKKKGWGVEDAATELQLNFEQAVLQQDKLHEEAAKAYKSWVRFYASYPKETRSCFNFQNLHLGHYAKSFALRDPPSKVGGIGRPSNKIQRMSKKKKPKPTRLETDAGRMRNLIISEFASGL